MTEAEWLACEDAYKMLGCLHEKPSDRKLHLVAVASCHLIRPLLTPCGQSAVEVAERFADGSASDTEYQCSLSEAEAEARSTASPASATVNFAVMLSYGVEFVLLPTQPTLGSVASKLSNVAWAVGQAAGEKVSDNESHAVTQVESQKASRTQANLLRDIFGNPFRPSHFAPAWRTETAVAVTAGIYAERAFDRMPILADALEDAGCDDPDILAHCRGPGPHVRGCWVVDLVLGKE